MYLAIEQNKLKGRFGGTVTTAILEVLNKETDVKHQEYIYQVLSRFNATVKVVEEAIGISPTEEEWSEYEEEYHDMYINILLNNLNKLYFRFGKTNFMEQYSQVYWKHTQEFILQLWKELPDGKSVAANEASFIKIFDDFFAETMKVFPEFIVKQLREFQNLYRASRYEVFDNYKYIIPNPAYCHDTRWNEDGEAFLYLAYDNEGQDCQNIKLAQKTCFEELRAKNGEQLSVCKFKVVHKRVKILDLSYDGIDYDEQLKELTESEHDYKERIMQVIQDKPKLKNRMVSYAKHKDEESFRAELELHSDQGFQYTSQAYFSLTKSYHITPSMSRHGNPYDNALAENFFSILKTECIYRTKIRSYEEARLLITAYIHFYNNERIQLKTKLTPLEKRSRFVA